MNHSSRIQQLFAHNKAFIAYLTAGDGGINRTLDAALALIDGGINMLEIGMPFSDPIADGPVIQCAAARSLAAGTTFHEVLWLTKQLRYRSNIPLILFSYCNPILSALAANLLHEAKDAGIDGLLLVDCPLEESQLIQQQCRQYEIDLIYIISSTTTLARVERINQHAHGFLYYACQKGTTGLRNALPDDFPSKIKTIKSVVDLPVVVGFGISNQAMVDAVLAYADGVVLGSLFVNALAKGSPPASLVQLTRELLAGVSI